MPILFNKQFRKVIVALLFTLVNWISIHSVAGQQLQLFQQKTTDDFLLNPGFVGLSGGSASFNYRRQWSGVEGTPQIFYANVHTVIKEDQFSVGVNAYSNRSNLIENMRVSLASAYILNLNSDFKLSFGLGVELVQDQLDESSSFIKDPDDPILANFNNNLQADLYSGVVLKHEYFDFGLSAGRMIASSSDGVLASYYSASLNGYYPLQYGRGIIEPRLLYLRYQDFEDIYNAALFYTLDDRYIVGLSYQSGTIVGSSVGLKLENRYVLAYSPSMKLGQSGFDLGVSHEITLRYNFNNQYYRTVNPSEYTPRRSNSYKRKTN